MTVCHVISMDSIEQMGDITRLIFEEGTGYHIWSHIDGEQPIADIYLLHCFKNGKYIEKFYNYDRPYPGSKIISLIHSSAPCEASINSDMIVSITQAAYEDFRETSTVLQDKDIPHRMIPGFIDIDRYADTKIDYDKPHFGKLSRLEVGKFHYYWGDLVRTVLANNEEVTNYIVTPENFDSGHDRVKALHGIEINDIEGKKRVMAEYSIYADAHNDMHPFLETFCIAMLEAMAAGQAICILGTNQPAMVEVLGDSGLIAANIFEFKDNLEKLIADPELRKEYGKKAKARANYFNKEHGLMNWNLLFNEVTNA
mgnify:CR=1 FL=1|jgi:glycosyltransferase involved in cell wall biosynthesis